MSPDYYLDEAKKEALKSNCEQTHWGAVLVSWQGEIIARGHNHIADVELLRWCAPCIRKDIRSCTRIEYCSAIHAEVDVIINAIAEYKTIPPDTDMFLYGYSEKKGNPEMPILMRYYPCMQCGKYIMYYGVRRLWFYRPVAQTEEERNWLPFPKHERDYGKAYLPDFITGTQYWFHPGVWLGLEGHTIGFNAKEFHKLGQEKPNQGKEKDPVP